MTARQTTAGTPADGYRADPPPIPRPRSSDDPREPGRRADGGRHRPPPPPPRRLTARGVAIVDGAVLAFGLTFGIYTSAVDFALDGTRAVTTAAPTAVELPREPTGHGGPIAYPTFADPHVWTESKGPVIANGQKLPAVTVVAAPELTASFPKPETVAPTQAPATTPAPTVAPTPTVVAEPTRTDEPVLEPTPTEPTPTDVPVVTEPVATEPVPTPTETPAVPTEPAVTP